MWDDQKNFYSAESLTLLGGGLIVGGAMANSSIDDGIHRHFQSSVRGATSDDWFESLHASKELGNGVYTLPVLQRHGLRANCSQTMPLWKRVADGVSDR